MYLLTNFEKKVSEEHASIYSLYFSAVIHFYCFYLLVSGFIYAYFVKSMFTSLNQQQFLFTILFTKINLKKILMLQRSITSFHLDRTQVIILLSNHLLILGE